MWWKQKELFAIEPQRAFDGATYDPEKDYKRLNGQLMRVFDVMRPATGSQFGPWRTLDEIARLVGGSQAGISARLRDLRKAKFGSHVVDRRRIGEGLFQYRVTIRT